MRITKRLFQFFSHFILCSTILMAQNISFFPVAPKIEHRGVRHSEVVLDDYHWLRDKKNPQVIAYLEAENAYAQAAMKSSDAFQEGLYKEMLSRIKQTDLQVPVRRGQYFYYSRTEEGKQYPIYCRKRGNLEAPEAITLDLNDLAKGLKYLGLGAYSVSDDGHLLAYSTDITGFREYTLYVKDLRSGKLLNDRIEKVNSVVWAADHKTIFYVIEDHAKRPYRLMRHRLGETKDELVYEEKDELYRLSVSRSKDLKYIFLASHATNATEYRYLSAHHPEIDFKLLLAREKDHKYDVEHREGLFYIRTNKDAKNFRLVTAPVHDPSSKNWKEFIPHRKDVLITDFEPFKNHAVVHEKEKGLNQLSVVDFQTGKSHRIHFLEPVYAAFGGPNPEFETSTFRFNYQSMVTSPTVFDYDLNTHERRLMKQQEVLGGYDPKQYATERLWAKALDGTLVPISLVYKQHLKRNGKAPALLYGYGSYGYGLSPTFSSARLSLLNRGFVYAIAHVRGGDEMGEAWHDDGMLMKKKNTFTDFIACAEHLIAEKWTSKDQLVIFGASAGGLLMGTVTNMRPDLFKAVVSLVPFVDVMNTMMDPNLPLTIQEYLEWGDPNEKTAYDYMKSYSPYDNLDRKPYPAILLRTSLNDSQVMYWESAKYVAKLRTLKTDKNELLLKANMGAGHGGASGRYDALRETAFDYVWILKQVGISK